ncbi:MAG: hypothetical protein HYV67_03425 [Candidatus Taylorbacteria bacterium]|nr:hypothetical protein [Candidatus Taylorbacteria bacterium]
MLALTGFGIGAVVLLALSMFFLLIVLVARSEDWFADIMSGLAIFLFIASLAFGGIGYYLKKHRAMSHDNAIVQK